MFRFRQANERLSYSVHALDMRNIRKGVKLVCKPYLIWTCKATIGI